MEKLILSIIKRLYFAGPQSIAEISSALDRSIPSVTGAINKSVANGYIVKNGQAPSTGGRRAASFALSPRKLPFILCVAIDQYYCSVVVVDFLNNPQTEILTEQIRLNEADAYSKICSLITKIIPQLKNDRVFAIGMTIPGFVDIERGVNNSFSPNSPLYNIRENIEKKFNLPTFLENDSTAIAIAEHNFGKGKNSRNIMVVNLNWGVGLGMIIDNVLYRGHSGYAGEFSHIPLSDQSKLCSCGKKGCLEVEASLVAARSYANEKLLAGEESILQPDFKIKGFITGDELLNASLKGDQLAIQSLQRIGYMLGKGIATLIHIINPAKVIISGRGAKAEKVLWPEIQSAILEFSIPRLAQFTTIEFSNIENIQLLGSACVAVANTDKTILN